MPSVDCREVTRRRDPEMERRIIEHAAATWDPVAITAHAQARSTNLAGPYVDDPFTIRAGHDWLKETRAELADAANYLAWWLEDRLESDDMEARMRVHQALNAVVAAYELTRGD